MDPSKKSKKPAMQDSGSQAQRDGDVSDASYRSRSKSGERSQSAPGSRISLRNPSKNQRIHILSSDDDFESSGFNTVRTRSRSKKKSLMDAKNSALNPMATPFAPGTSSGSP